MQKVLQGYGSKNIQLKSRYVHYAEILFGGIYFFVNINISVVTYIRKYKNPLTRKICKNYHAKHLEMTKPYYATHFVSYFHV